MRYIYIFNLVMSLNLTFISYTSDNKLATLGWFAASLWVIAILIITERKNTNN